MAREFSYAKIYGIDIGDVVPLHNYFKYPYAIAFQFQLPLCTPRVMCILKCTTSILGSGSMTPVLISSTRDPFRWLFVNFKLSSDCPKLVLTNSQPSQVQSYPALVNEVARILRPGGLFLACEWGRCAAMVENMNPMEFTPYACRFYQAVSESLYRAQGLVPIANRLEDYIASSGRFDRVECKRFSMPIGTWHRDPWMQYLGGRFRDSLRIYVSSMELMMIQAGRDPTNVRELVLGYLREMYTVQGMICYFYTVQANRCN